MEARILAQNNEWMNNPELSQIPFQKLDFLQNMLFESKKYSGKELFPFFMSLAMKAQKQGITYTQSELDIIIPVIKQYANEDEVEKMNKIITMFNKNNK